MKIQQVGKFSYIPEQFDQIFEQVVLNESSFFTEDTKVITFINYKYFQ